MSRQQPFLANLAATDETHAQQRIDLLDRVANDRRLPLVAITAGLLESA